MTDEALKQEIEKLSSDERVQLAQWVNDRDNDAWDEQMARDAGAGKLVFLKVEAENAARNGTLKSLGF